MSKTKVIIILAIIFLIGVFFRFYQLGNIPSSLNWDEVSWGYNAYSIATTGRDEYGSFLPLSFRAFGDYKQPMYVYLDALPTLVFGLTAFAVRFPSALLGSLTILSVFFFVRGLFHLEKRGIFFALVAAGLFAISPWSIQFSRVAFEANVGVFFTITGVAIFLSGLRTKKIGLMALGSVVLSLSCYTYHSQKLFTPLLFLGLLFFAREFLWKQKKYLVVLLIVFFLANIFWVVDSRTTARGRSVIFTSNQTQLLADDTEKLIADNEQGDVLGKILHNRRFVYANVYVKNYLQHFDPGFLFLKGDNPRHHPPFMGVEYLAALPFIIWGIVTTWKKYKFAALLLFPWLLLAPLASSLTVDSPNASRSMVFLPLWQVFAGIGLVAAIWDRHLKKIQLSLVFVIICMFCANVGYYTHNYFSHTNTEFASYWQYGYKEAVLATKDKPRVFFASDVEQPYIFYLFYSGITSQEYLDTGGSNRIWAKCFQIRQSFFGNCQDKEKPGDVVVTTKVSLPQTNLAKSAEIHYPNDEVALRIFTVK